MTTLNDAYYRRLAAFHLTGVQEFYTPGQPRDKDGQWSKVPGRPKGEVQGQSKGKVWSGVSADPATRVKPKATVRMDEPGLKRKALAKKVFEADLGDGYSSHVTEATYADNSIYVTGEFRKNGRVVGSFDRMLTTADDGSLYAIHQLAELERPHQGYGVVDRFNAHSVQEYQKLGVDRIELTAGLTVGGFAWARQGFRYNENSYVGDPHIEGDGIDHSKKTWLLSQLKRIRVSYNKPVVRPHKKQLEKEIKALEKAVEAGEDVQPIHLASIGEKYARWNSLDLDGREYQTWPGKQLLLGQNWRGVYYFDAANPVTAAASNLEHARLRPQFYEDVELQLMAEEFACHDPSCRPPTSGGTGGSSPSIHSRPRLGTADITAHQFHASPSAEMVKHFGAITVAAHMTAEERATIAKELDFVPNKSLDRVPSASHAPFNDIAWDADGPVPLGVHLQWKAANQYRQAMTSVGSAGMRMRLGNDEARKLENDFNDKMEIVDDAFMEFKATYWNKDLPQDWKDRAAANLSAKIESELGISPASAFVNYVNNQWAQSSRSPVSTAMHLEVAKQHSLDSSRFEAWTKETGVKGDGDPYEYLKVTPKSFEIVARAEYATTQEILKDHNVYDVQIHRGVKVDPDYPVDLTEVGRVQPNPLSSWSSDRDEAVEFASGHQGGYVFSAEVPARDVFSIAAITGMGSLAETELIMIGRPVRNAQIQKYDTPSWANEPVIDAQNADDWKWLQDNYDGKEFAADDEPEPFYIDEDEENADWIKKAAPKSVVAAYFTRCEHGNLTAACHDASCRPPTAGGTGGSRRRGTAVGDSSKPLSSSNGQTEFGKMIQGLVQSSGLYNLTQSAVHGVHESAVENRLNLDRKTNQDRYRTLEATEISIPYHMRSGNEDMLLELGRAKREILERNDVRLEKQDWEPKTKYEKILLDLVNTHVANDSPYGTTLKRINEEGESDVPGAHITLKVKPLPSPRTTLMSHGHIISDDAESKTTAIGTIIRDEINRRTSEQFNVMEHTDIWNEATNKAMAIVAKSTPEIRTASDFEAWLKRNSIVIGNGTDRRLNVYVGSGMKPDERDEIESIFKRANIKSTSLVGHIRNGQAEMHQSVLKDVLSEIRPMGGEFKDTPRHRKTKFKSALSTNEQLTRAAPWYPADWIKASNEAGTIEFKSTPTRAHYRHGLVAEVKLDGSVPTAVHELAHRMEYTVPGVRALERQFYERRTAGEPLEQLSKLSPGSRYGRDEKARKDEFFSPYAGKDYGGDAYELMSMGMESLPYRHSWDKMDPDYQAFVLGVLATAYH